MKNRNRLVGTSYRRYGALAGIGQADVYSADDASMFSYAPEWSPTQGDYADSPGMANSWFQSFTESLIPLGEKILSLQQVKEINDANLDRAKRGLAPLDARAYAPQVNFGVAPQTEETMKYIAYGALALGAFYVLSRRRG